MFIIVDYQTQFIGNKEKLKKRKTTLGEAIPFTDAVVQWSSCKKRVLKNFAKFTGKHMCWSPFF